MFLSSSTSAMVGMSPVPRDGSIPPNLKPVKLVRNVAGIRQIRDSSICWQDSWVDIPCLMNVVPAHGLAIGPRSGWSGARPREQAIYAAHSRFRPQDGRQDPHARSAVGG